MEDVFEVQDEISAAIADALKITLVGDAAQPNVDRHTDDLDAYHLYLQGRHSWYARFRGALEKALRCYEQAIDKDPQYALAHAGVAEAYSILGLYGFLPMLVLTI